MTQIMKNGMLAVLVALGVLAQGINEARATISIDLVNVGNAGNAADTTTYGAVSYNYAIAKYDVTIGQYTEFLNAVAATDAYGLYNTVMGTDLHVAGIARSGSSGSYTYSAINNGGSSANRPITYVSWFDAARFSNWMNNGQGSGSTETGAYTLNGATSGIITKNAGAIWYLPSEDEWYKAAYYDASLNSGSGGYWAYPTRSNTAPGNVTGSAPNQANINNGVYSVTQSSSYLATQYYVTDVGAFSGSGSAYGTYDQGGDVWQWNDAVVSGSSRRIRGGSWFTAADVLQSSISVDVPPTAETSIFGFRLASVPEPSTVGLVLLAGTGLMVWKRRKFTL